MVATQHSTYATKPEGKEKKRAREKESDMGGGRDTSNGRFM